MEYDEAGNLYAGSDRLVTYTFQENGEAAVDAVSGVSPDKSGTFTVTNAPRTPTRLTVTKNWVNKTSTDPDTVYFRLDLLGEKNMTKKDVYTTLSTNETTTEAGTQKVWMSTEDYSHWVPYTNRLKLEYHPDTETWDEISFEFPAGYLVNSEAGNFLGGIAVIETDASGNDLPNTDGQYIAYIYTDASGNETTGISKQNLAPLGDGTLTIRNAKRGNDITLKKLWKNGGEPATADAPDSVREIRVQLWKQTDGEVPEQITELGDIVLNHGNHFTCNSPINLSVQDGTTYYAKEVSVTYLDADGDIVPVDNPDVIAENWFIGDQGPIRNAIRLETTDMTGAGDFRLSGDLTNKPPVEETTELSFTKAWYNKDGSQRTAAEGETINVKLWSKTASETTRVTDLETFTPENLTVDAVKDELVLTCGAEGAWPTGTVSGLPRYRNGELVEYYVEEVSTSKDDTLYYGVTYKKGESPAVSDPDKARTHDDPITVINTVKDRSIEVEKAWGDSLSHAKEEVTVVLYRWTDENTFTPPNDAAHIDTEATSASTPQGDQSTMTLKVVVDDSGIPSDGYTWRCTLQNWTDLSNYWKEVPNSGLEALDSNENRTITIPNLVVDHTYRSYFNSGIWGSQSLQWYAFFDGEAFFPSNSAFDITAIGGEHTLYFNVTGERPTAGLVPSGHITIDAVPDGAQLVPESADIKNPVILNSEDVPGWTYRWDKLPGDDGAGHKYHYAVVETLLNETGALKDRVSYVYHYDDDAKPSGTLDKQKYVTGVTITNTPEYPTPPQTELTIYKVDNLNRETILTGAKFKLTKPDNTYQEQTLEDGHWKLTGLVPGAYTLKEIEAPTGYVTLDDEITFTVGADNTITTNGELNFVHYEGGILTVGNRQGVELPATGGMGVGAYRLGGAALLLAATGLAAASPLKRSRADRARRRKGGEGET